MNLSCPACSKPLAVAELDTRMTAERTCAHCFAQVGITVAVTLLETGTCAAPAAEVRKAVVAVADAEVRASYTAALKSRGWTVHETTEARETLRAMGQDLPELAVIDGAFPPIFGMGIGEIIKKSAAIRSARVLGVQPDSAADLPVSGADRTIPLATGRTMFLKTVADLVAGIDLSEAMAAAGPAIAAATTPAPTPVVDPTPTNGPATPATADPVMVDDAPVNDAMAVAPLTAVDPATPADPMTMDLGSAADTPSINGESGPMVTATEPPAMELPATEPMLNDALQEGTMADLATADMAAATAPAMATTTDFQPKASPATGPPSTPAASANAPAADPDHAKAQRLARIIVSDVALYNAKAVENGIRAGDLKAALKDPLEEGIAHYKERISADIREGTDYFNEALDAFVARKMGASQSATA